MDSDPENQLIRDQLQAQIVLIPNLLDALSIEEFIEPLDEQIIDDESDILNVVIESYTQDLEDKDISDEEGIEMSRVTISEAIQALEQLKLRLFTNLPSVSNRITQIPSFPSLIY
jgi:hypothetical protein